MKLGKLKTVVFFLFLFLIYPFKAYSEEKIISVPLINLEELSPTFEEDKDELEKNDKNVSIDLEKTLDQDLNLKKSDKIFINLRALDKITAKTSNIQIEMGDKKFFGPLEIKALKCQHFEGENSSDTVAYIQVKDISINDNERVFLFNGWTFASSPTLQSMDHPVYDLWITGCENI
tara:strand:- start:43 stop:570 length:528 start_codon:yes stop_codon:yes gene_type:complete